MALPAGQEFTAGTQLLLVRFQVPDAIAGTTVSSTVIAFDDSPLRREIMDAAANPVPVTFENGLFTVSRGFEADVTPRPFGNNDGTLRVSDWTQVGLFAARLSTAGSASEFQRADCAPRGIEGNLTLGNGIISLADWVQAGRYVAGLQAATPGGGPIGPIGLLNRTAAIESYVRKSWVRSRRIWVKDATAQAGQNFFIRIELEASGQENAIGFSLQYDSKVLRFVAARPGQDATGATVLTNTRDTESGRVGLALALAPGGSFAAGTRTLLEAEFVALAAGLDSTAAITFADAPIAREIVSLEADELRGSYENGTVVIRAAGAATGGPAQLHGLSRSAQGEVALRLTGEPGRTYVIETSADLAVWASWKTIVLTNEAADIVDAETRNMPRRFYRVRAGP